MAMSFSKPIIATSVGSNQDIIQDGNSGILVPPNEPQTLAKAITALLDRPDWGKQIGESANKFVTQELSWKNLATKTRDFYLKVLAN